MIIQNERYHRSGNMTSPKVSITIPVYNQHDYLRRCMDSVLSQSLSDIEIICIDDGSTDDSLDILREYAGKDQRVKVFDRTNHGYGASVNFGFQQSVGEYVAIVEPDDAIEPDMMSALYEIAERDGLDWVRSDLLVCSSAGEKEKRVRESITFGKDYYNIVLDPRTDVRPHRTGVRTWTGLYRRAFIVDNGIRHNETPGAAYQDLGFYLRTLYPATRVEFADVPFYRWTSDNPGSSMNAGRRKAVEAHKKEYELDLQYLKEHPELSGFIVGGFYYRMFCTFRWLAGTLGGDDRKRFMEYSSKELRDAYRDGKIVRDYFSIVEWIRFRLFIRT